MQITAMITSWGPITLEESAGAIERCTLPFLATEPREDFSFLEIPVSTPSARFVEQLLTGRPAHPPPVHLTSGTPFQQKVWRAIAAIPCGATQTYGELARAIGHPNAARAVGSACGKNPIPLFIPCHRVLGSQGLHGFSAGIPWKKRLLNLEEICRTQPELP
jgi:methylated-DNA-[protein]-cysteine S-methyltransferase